MKKIAVGSENPVKIEAVRLAFSAVWPEEEWVVEGVKVSSGVSDQPMSDSESVRGATTRAKAAQEALDAEYGVGLEGGMQEIEGEWYDGGWIVVYRKDGVTGKGSTVRMPVPPKMLALIQQGMELGEVDDVVFKKENSKQINGHFGLMTNDVITRTAGYRDGVVAALTLFIHPHLRD